MCIRTWDGLAKGSIPDKCCLLTRVSPPRTVNEGINNPEQSRQDGKTVSAVTQLHTGENKTDQKAEISTAFHISQLKLSSLPSIYKAYHSKLRIIEKQCSLKLDYSVYNILFLRTNSF